MLDSFLKFQVFEQVSSFWDSLIKTSLEKKKLYK